MKPLNPNSMIQGRYLIVQPIGKGGMGEVYLAVDQRLGSAVALKRTFFSEDSTLGSAFEREARILARLRHPVLPKVIDHFAENGDQFLVMEHISGDDISKRLEAAKKAFPLSWVMFWSDQMLDALAYLHSHEPPIVHRDIKPQNLKLTDDNHIVLLDFGLSKDFDSTTSGLNSASVAGYSPHFASMEQIRGTGTDARSDLYSLAATLYQMLTNTIPPDALTRADAMLGGKPDPIRPLNEINPEVSPEISDVILKAVSIRQDQRFGTALEMQKALRRAFNQGKAEVASKPSIAVPVVSATADTERDSEPKEVPAQAPAAHVSEMPEMETQIRQDIPLAFEQTLDMAKPTPEEIKQSDVKTAVLNLADANESSDAMATTESTPSEPVKKDTSAVAAAAAAAGTSAPFKSSQTPPAPTTSAAKKSSSGKGVLIGALAVLILLLGSGLVGAWLLLGRSGDATSDVPSQNPANTSTPAATPEAPALTNTEPAPPENEEPVVAEKDNANVSTDPTVSQAPQSAPRPSAPSTKQPQKPTTTSDKAPPKTKKKDERTVILQ